MLRIRSDLMKFIKKHGNKGSLRGVSISNSTIYEDFMHKGTKKPRGGWPKECKAMYTYVETIIDQLNQEESRNGEEAPGSLHDIVD